MSVGEVLAVEKLIRLLLERRPRQRIVLTTVTPTGQRIAKKWEEKRLRVFYFPFDMRFAVRRFFEAFRPSLLLLVETEIWPNVIQEAKERGIPVGVINGRLSERSFHAFRRFPLIFRPLFGNVDFFLVQSGEDQERLLALGVSPAKVLVMGNMKLDALDWNGRWQKDHEGLRQKWGFLSSDQVLIGGSTHAGEEEILLRVLRRLRGEGFPLKLLLAPRHIERSPKILKRALKEGFKSTLASGLHPSSEFEILILDQLGELRRLYAIADAVVMGGSLVRHGGQNPIEPASFSRAIIHGPWVFNFQEIYRRLDEEGGSFRVNGEEELAFALKRILSSDREKEYLGKQAYETLRKLQGATGRHFKWIEEKI